MLVADILRLSTRMFRTNRSRTILTILGISVGIGTILFLVSMGYGLQRLILGQITTSESLLSLDVSTGDAAGLKLNNESVEDIKKIAGVEKISPLVSITSQMNVSDISSELVTDFANSDYFNLEGTMLKKGNFYSDSEQDMNKIIISSSALKLFNLDENNCFDNKKIGFTLFLPDKDENGEKLSRNTVKLDQEFQIIGIIEEENSNYVYLPFGIIQKLNVEDYGRLKVKVDYKDNLNPVRESIIERGYMVSALSDIIEQANQIFRTAQIVLALFGIIALLVSAIGMFNTMTIALLERTQEIGIMKTLGATGMDIWNMFLGESFIIGFFGGVGGIIIGMTGGEVFNYGINFLAKAFGGEKIDLFYTPIWFIFFVIIFSTVVGLITGIYPASRAAKINCLEALRYK
ncbi:ABC transporter permease [Patescibacteria group bacterium]|nr:ABC transporter permease [Patescibacteria group bacterium]MBU4346971.1 ABC transporter permease [Patescibacteria group bacterium]MBU4455531.1 ABC transporter permease [Patescibacteria group bacterium]MCG2691170.1 ABC transporter permease [Candidatus Parcubacteria bacterium]